MKIGIGGLHIESCTFSPLLSREEDFRILRGSDLLASYPFLASAADAVLVPILYARALPGGPIESGFYRRIKTEFLQMLAENGPFEGLFLHMHGAVYVEGLEDAEGDFLTAIRGVVGADCFIAASYDLHGNLSPRVMESLDFLSAYRTAPHIDWYETLERVFSVLTRCLGLGLRPFKCYIPVPVLFSGEKSSTEAEPAASLYRLIPGVIAGDAVMDISLLIGYVWADEPRSSASVVAFGLDAGRVRAAARRLAQATWDARAQFQFGVTAQGVDACIRLALQPAGRPVLLSDSGDNPTAGGAGDTPLVLERLLALGVRGALVAGIADAAAVRRCEEAGVGACLELSLGGKLDPVHASPLAVQATVRALHTPAWTLNANRDASLLNPSAVLDVQGITVIITSRRTPFHRISDFTVLGLDPHAFELIVVKIGYLEPELRQLAGRALLALSPGAVDQGLESAHYQRLTHPIYPYDPDFAWSPPAVGMEG